MTMRVVLRGVAVLIGIMGMVDPAVTLARRVRPPLVVAVDSTLPAALTSAARLQDLLDEDYAIQVRGVEDMDRLPPCAPGESCVLVGGERWPVSRTPSAARIVGVIRIEEEPRPRVAIAGTTIPTPPHAAAVGQILVEMTGQGVTGQQSTLDVFDGDVPIGRAVHDWSADGRVTVPIEWWPLGDGLRRLSVRATRSGASGVERDDRVDAGVQIGAEPYNLLVYDTRPSWTSTFVRRAVEHDARLALRVVARLGPRLEVTAGEPFRLDDATLEDASAVVIGAPDGLSAGDVNALERFVRVRGGSLVLVPDRRPTGPIARLLHGAARSISSSMVERLEPAPVPVGDWRASELLVFRGLPAAAVPLASAGADPVVIVMPVGAGRIVVSGAMDAWRYRDADGEAFDRAWQTLVADAAGAGGRLLELTLDRSVVRPAHDVNLTVRVRSMAPPDAAVAVSATVACGDEPARMLRLWPTGDRRRFEGRFARRLPGRCQVAVSSSTPNASSATVDVVVADDARPAMRLSGGAETAEGGAETAQGTVPTHNAAIYATLDRITRAAGARIVSVGDETTLAGDVRRLTPVDMAPSRVRPMRSPWWIVPFAGCLGAEWWLRRRHAMR